MAERRAPLSATCSTDLSGAGRLAGGSGYIQLAETVTQVVPAGL